MRSSPSLPIMVVDVVTPGPSIAVHRFDLPVPDRAAVDSSLRLARQARIIPTLRTPPACRFWSRLRRAQAVGRGGTARAISQDPPSRRAICGSSVALQLRSTSGVHAVSNSRTA